MKIELNGLGRNCVQIGLCSELKDYIHVFEYMKYINIILRKLKKNLHKEVDLQIPRRISPSKDRSIMLVRIGNHYKKISGQYSHLMALFVLTRQYQNGTLHCRYCHRIVPDQCQIAEFLNFLASC